MEKLPTILGSIVAFVSIMTGAGWWLINQYFKKSEQLEALKENSTQKAIDGLGKVTKSLETDISSLRKRIDQVERTMIQAVSKTEVLKETFDRVGSILTRIVEFVDRKTEKSEMAQIGKNLFIVRSKKETKENT